MDNIRPEIRTFVVGTIGLATAAWNLAFTLGAYKTIFYSNIFSVWVMVTAVFLVILLVPEQETHVTWWGKLLMLIPTLGVALAVIDSIAIEREISNWFTIGLGVVAILVCLPYALYVEANVIHADLLQLPDTRLKIYLVIIVLVVGLIGVWVGANNHYFLTCGDFKIAGSDLPANCRPGGPTQLQVPGIQLR